MKQLLIVLLLACAVFSCGENSQQSPEAVTEKLYTALKNKDLERFKECFKEEKPALEYWTQFERFDWTSSTRTEVKAYKQLDRRCCNLGVTFNKTLHWSMSITRFEETSQGYVIRGWNGDILLMPSSSLE